MSNKMKNFKQIAFGLLVGALALSFSAFTTAKRADTYSFVHVANTTSNLRTDYIFRANQAGCNEGSAICKADWTQASAPAEGSNPALTAVQGDIENGDYQGN